MNLCRLNCPPSSLCPTFLFYPSLQCRNTRHQVSRSSMDPSVSMPGNTMEYSITQNLPTKQVIHQGLQKTLKRAPPLMDISTATSIKPSSKEANDFARLVVLLNKNEITFAQVFPETLQIYVILQDGSSMDIYVSSREDVSRAVSLLMEKGVMTKYKEEPKILSNAMINYLLFNLIIPTLFLMVFVRILTSIFQRGGKNGVFSFGENKAKFQEIPNTGVSFDDVAGCDNAKRDLKEIVEFLKSPEKFTKLGARIPKGCLLVGPSGTGKTLLAKAVAGEAKVPFFSCSASDWIEMFVGVGASRIRKLFVDAAEKAPCIIFVDEIDAVGKSRSGSSGIPGNDERDQTINQLLTEMDGFDGKKGIIVLAATNRPDVLDTALVRPGRFDRKIIVDRPDCSGRVAILKVHTKNKPLADDVSLETIAKITAGSSGADLQNLANEAAILASRKDRDNIQMCDFEDALDKIMLGEQRTSSFMSENQKNIISVHEAGHALVSLLVGDYDRLKKVTIIPRGSAGGVTIFEPNEERVDFSLYSKEYLQNQLCVALGGRVAEQLVFGDEKVTTGASSDLAQVMNITRRMVTDFGFSAKLGQVAWKANSAFAEEGKGYSEKTAYDIDQEIKKIVEKSYKRTDKLLKENKDKLMILAKALIEKETMDGDEVRKLLAL